MLGIALLLLALSPITSMAPIQASQLALLLAGVVALVVLNLVLVRRVLAPLTGLTK